MRLWLLVTLVAIAGAGEETDQRLEGDWGLARFLDPYRGGMWIGFGAGSKVKFESTGSSPILPDYANPKGNVSAKSRSLLEEKLVTAGPDKMVFEHRRLRFSADGKKGKWSKKSRSSYDLTPVEWKVEKQGDTTYSLRSEVLKAQNLRVTATLKATGESQVWRVTASERYGILVAVRLEPEGLRWHLSRMDVEAKVGKGTLKCREYKYTHDPPQVPTIPGHVADKTYLLCEKVPGYVVRARYRDFLGSSIVQSLVSFKATRRH